MAMNINVPTSLPEPSSTTPSTSSPSPTPPVFYMRLALEQSRNAPCLPTNYRVGAVLVSPSNKTPVIATGYSMELPGNTHAEECCFIKVREQLAKRARGEGRGQDDDNDDDHDDVAAQMYGADTVLYTTMEPCSMRLSGKETCVSRILGMREEFGGLDTVYVGVVEPKKFVELNDGRDTLERAGVKVVHVTGLQQEIMEVVMAAHTDPSKQL